MNLLNFSRLASPRKKGDASPMHREINPSTVFPLEYLAQQVHPYSTMH